jgi:copper(I)-binding protein
MPRLTRRRLVPLLTGGLALTLVPVSAHDGHHPGTPAASPAAAIATNTGTGAAYMTIANSGDEPERLVSARTDAAKTVQLHAMEMDGGVMRMRELVQGVEIPAGESVSFDPEIMHFMLVNLNHDLAPGSTYDLMITFEHAGEVTVPVVVQFDPPEDDATTVVGNISIEHAWSRSAPMLTSGTDEATPVASPTS